VGQFAGQPLAADLDQGRVFAVQPVDDFDGAVEARVVGYGTARILA
jgi:hypothetical protein